MARGAGGSRKAQITLARRRADAPEIADESIGRALRTLQGGEAKGRRDCQS